MSTLFLSHNGTGLTSLRNNHAFPPFHLLSPTSASDASYFSIIEENILRPKRHWCFIAQITKIEYFIRPRLHVVDKAGSVVQIIFYTRPDGILLERDDPNWNTEGFKVGHCIALLYPVQNVPLREVQTSIKHEVASYAKAIPLALNQLLALSDRIQLQNLKLDGKMACHACGKQKENLLKCARCGLSWYCDETCQQIGWSEKGHKEDCKIMKDKDMQGLLARNWNRFDGGFWRFPMCQPSSPGGASSIGSSSSS